MEHCLAAIQLHARPFEPERNRRRAEELVRQAQRQGARLAVLPELFNVGYHNSPANQSLAETQSGPTVAWLQALGRELGMTLIGGFAERGRRHFYNSLAVCPPCGPPAIYRKRHLVWWEHRYFRAGRKPRIVETPAGRVGLAICADMLYRRTWAEYRGKIDLAVVAAAWPRFAAAAGRRAGWMFRTSRWLARALPRRVARELGVPVIFANQCGTLQTSVPLLASGFSDRFTAGSSVHDATGRLVARARDREDVLCATFEAASERTFPCCTLT